MNIEIDETKAVRIVTIRSKGDNDSGWDAVRIQCQYIENGWKVLEGPKPFEGGVETTLYLPEPILIPDDETAHGETVE